MKGISKLLSTDGYIQVNKSLIKLFGLHEAIIIGELCAEYNYWERAGKLVDDMFYSTRDNIEDNTGLNDHYQRKALSTLKEAGIIEVKKQGIPAVNYYKIRFDKLLNILSSSSERDEELDTDEMKPNNNKQTNLNKELSLSKDKDNNISKKQDNFLGSAKRKNKKFTYQDCLKAIDDYTDDEKLRDCLRDYLQVRLSLMDKYPMRMINWNSLLKTLTDRLAESSGNVSAVDIVRNSIDRSYPTFYALHNKEYYNPDDKKALARKFCQPENGGSIVYTEEEREYQEKWREEMRRKGKRVDF